MAKRTSSVEFSELTRDGGEGVEVDGGEWVKVVSSSSSSSDEDEPAPSQLAFASSKRSRVSVMVDTLIHSSPLCVTMSTRAPSFLACPARFELRVGG